MWPVMFIDFDVIKATKFLQEILFVLFFFFFFFFFIGNLFFFF